MEFSRKIGSIALQAGESVRVWTAGSIREHSQRATITLDNEDGTYDVIFDAGEIEECAVSTERIQACEHFEEASITSASKSTAAAEEEAIPLTLPTPLQYKEYGNILFSTCKDWDAAMVYYKKALSGVQDVRGVGWSSVGAGVLVSSDGTVDIKPGIVSSNEGDYVDLMYDDDTEEEAVQVTKLLPLAEIRFRSLQRACYLNMARCALKKCTFGWTIRYSSLALAILQVMLGEFLSIDDIANGTSQDMKRQAADSLLLRGKALLLAGRPGLASNDARVLQSLNNAKGTQLLREIHTFRSDRCKRNKRLARDVVNWVQTAMSISEGAGGTAGAGGMGIGAEFQLPEDDDDGDDVEEV